VVGIIGRNGAGKSTLLKILSRITEPSEGRVTLRGRVASLLEVGTGFHPELTGRENIFLNGAILGMSKAEIRKKFDEIVAFAEVERFLDTPVKRYSSGMYVRLAFAVAAHLEPEILVVDEVLAVGDAEFQKKCLGKMKDVATGGRTVLFVSHNMMAVRRLCEKGICLQNGKVVFNGSSNKAIESYLVFQKQPEAAWNYKNRGSKVRIQSIEVFQNNIKTNNPSSGAPVKIEITLKEKPLQPFQISLMIYESGQKIVNLWSQYKQHDLFLTNQKVICKIKKWPFRETELNFELYTEMNNIIEDWIENCLILNSKDGDFYNTGIVTNKNQGYIFLEHDWS
jgi:lipopolysaccharide transport system ATP-binding protein